MSRTSAAVQPKEPSAATGERNALDSHPAVLARGTRGRGPQDLRLWGFVRHLKDGDGTKSDMEEADIGLWLDEKRCRFLVVADKKLMDDLAPIEFIQFIRAFRHSTSQILYKFRYDGAGRQPFMVWC